MNFSDLALYAQFLVLGLTIVRLTYIGVRWLISVKRKGVEATRISGLEIFFLMPVAFLGVILLAITLSTYSPDRDFKRERWFSRPNTRYDMTESIVKSQILIGKEKRDIRSTIGDPAYQLDSTVWVYDLGRKKSLFGGHNVELEVRFDRGRVVYVHDREVEEE